MPALQNPDLLLQTLHEARKEAAAGHVGRGYAYLRAGASLVVRSLPDGILKERALEEWRAAVREFARDYGPSPLEEVAELRDEARAA
jgi:hypothetical protein